ncbi:MAG: Polyketide biosynthesis cytochrome P450 PksS [Acidimicrobiales bacterium]|nr:MAG: cytochrome P450 [Actinomycetota bacterium]MBV6509336.1 Polyketide biosynthesis cytochrome P450 PksS [Acidimicrobiales bacterium]RIK04626.1 MAG: cytochrome P450 [Acidobacteriota bacterium]
MHFDPFTPEAIEDPYPQYRRFREDAPVYWSDKIKSWCLFGYDDVRELFCDQRFSTDRSRADKYKGRPPPASTELRTVQSDPPASTQVRKLLTLSLTPKVRAAQPLIDALIDEQVEVVEAATERAVGDAQLAGEIDFIDEFAYALPVNVIAELFAVPRDDWGQFQQWSFQIARGMDHFYSKSDVGRALGEFANYFFALASQRRENPGEDLISKLLEVENDGDRLNDVEVVSMCTTLVFAGHETTVNLLGNGMLALLREPEQLRMLAGGAVSPQAAMEELVRYDGPAQLISRTAVEEVEMRGQRIDPGKAVVAMLGSANRDPSEFDEPDSLDLARDPNNHLAFGLGAHFCPGANLSRMETRAAFPAFLRRFPDIRLGDTPHSWRPTAVLRGLEHLPVRVSRA